MSALNKNLITWKFITRKHKIFEFYAHVFYFFDISKNTTVKDIPALEILMEHLTPRALAYLYMDDGTLQEPGCTFCTECFSKEEILRLKEVFQKK